MISTLVVLTGASGSGKTTLARYIQEHYATKYEVLFFDSIGVPPVDQMEKEYGSGEEWQRIKTLKWIEKIRPLLSADKPILFEGQTRITFIKEALAKYDLVQSKIILVDCDDTIRAARLSTERNQPELANPTMMNWARFLRREALTLGSEILDTGLKPFDECVAFLVKRLNGDSI